MGSFTTLLLGGDIHPGASLNQSHIGFSCLEVSIYLGCAFFALVDYRRMAVSSRAAWPFLLIALIAILSTAWSVDPELTLRRSGVLLGTTSFGIYLGGRYSIEEFQKLLLHSLLAIVAASLILLILSPGTALDPSSPGSFRGITVQKNFFGEYMGLLLLLGVTYRFRTRRSIVRLAVILPAMVLLLWAHSGTSILSIAAALLVLPILRMLRSTKHQALAVTMIFAVVVAAGFTFFSALSDSVLGLLGKDPTLTGRTLIWEFAWQAILRRPLLGYGYDSFWLDTKGASAQIDSLMNWNIPNSHNGYLEALLGFGAIGTCLIAVALFRTSRGALAHVRSQQGSASLWPFAFLLYFLVHAMAEASLVTRDEISYFLLVVLSTSLALRRRKQSAVRSTALSRLRGGLHVTQQMLPAVLTDSGWQRR
jgi:O-antigen ligase